MDEKVPQLPNGWEMASNAGKANHMYARRRLSGKYQVIWYDGEKYSVSGTNYSGTLEGALAEAERATRSPGASGG